MDDKVKVILWLYAGAVVWFLVSIYWFSDAKYLFLLFLGLGQISTILYFENKYILDKKEDHA